MASSDCGQCSRPNCNGLTHLILDEECYLGCNECGIELNDIIDLLNGITVRHQESCEICDLYYTTEDQQEYHIYSHFREGTDEQKILCIACKTKLNTRLEAVEVINNNEQVDGLPTSATKKHTLGKPQTISNKRVVCQDCPEVFDTLNKLNYHRKRVHPKLKKVDFPCRVCDVEIFNNQAERRLHENEIHRDPDTKLFPCTFCEKVCANVSLLEFHLLKHTQKKTHTCDVCGKSFGRLGHMEYHRSTHTELKLIECVLCTGKTFKTAHSLQRHISRMHSEKPAYPCDHCDKVFKDSSDRRRHLWTHGGYEKRFQCEICSKKFFENKALRFHMRIHAKDVNDVEYIQEEMEEGPEL